MTGDEETGEEEEKGPGFCHDLWGRAVVDWDNAPQSRKKGRVTLGEE